MSREPLFHPAILGRSQISSESVLRVIGHFVLSLSRRDGLRYAVTSMTRAGLVYGHGTDVSNRTTSMVDLEVHENNQRIHRNTHRDSGAEQHG